MGVPQNSEIPPAGSRCPAGSDIGIVLPIAEVRAAARRPEVIAAMRRFYLEADERIAANSPVCWNRGECCQFGRYGHRLYVTALEAAYYLACGDAAPTAAEDACPHAIDGRCHARDRRPLGCRIFYCDPGAQHWQGPLTEQLLNRLRAMHEELQVPYFYADWMAVLRAIGDGGA